MDMEQYMGIFVDESREHLQVLNDCLLQLEKDPDRLDLLNEVFRSAHTLKGMAGAMGFERMATLTHEMENVLDQLRTGEKSVNGQMIQVLFSCLDVLESLTQEITTDGIEQTDVQAITKLLGTLEQEVAAAEEKEILYTYDSLNEHLISVANTAYDRNFTTYNVRISFAQDCLLKAARAFMVYRDLDLIGEVVHSSPDIQDIEEEKFDQEIDIVFLTQEDKTVVEETINNISDVSVVSIQQIEQSQAQDSLVVESKENNITSNSSNMFTDKEPSRNSGDEYKQKKIKTNQTVRVDIERLDSLMNLVGELVINKTRLEQIGSTNQLSSLSEAIEHIDRITNELQEVVMKVRMVPIEQVFNRFPRMVRDLSKELNKEVELIVQGKETELDRTVIDEIGDPLVHLLRNAIDHGIEDATSRLSLGKPSHGTIHLTAMHEGNNVVIRIEDDGKGLDREKIKAKAVERGVVLEQDVVKLDDNELFNLVFRAGFSTAEKVTDISGRGVGLDVVKHKIESLGGEVNLETKKGEGSVFTVRLPLTLAIIQALLVKSIDETYAIPLGVIQETVSIKEENIKTIQKREVVTLRGEVLPLLRLDKLLDIPSSYSNGDSSSELFVVVVRKGDKRAGLIVNELVGQQDIVIKSLSSLLNGMKGIAGATILGDGKVALILDIGTLF